MKHALEDMCVLVSLIAPTTMSKNKDWRTFKAS